MSAASNPPYPKAIRPYLKGYSQEQDEKLARELFFGTSTFNKKTSRWHHDYPPTGGSHERQGIEALQRLLLFSCGDLDSDILAGLLCSLDDGGSFGRRLVFELRKRKRPPGSATDLQIALQVRALRRENWKITAAVAHVSKQLGLTEKTVYAARRRIRTESPWLEV
jgi:hypothetical protein